MIKVIIIVEGGLMLESGRVVLHRGWVLMIADSFLDKEEVV